MSARDHAGSETSGQEHGGTGINHNYVNSSQYFIGNLPRNTTERDVVEFFAKYGPIMHFNMCRTADGRTRGFGWLRFTKIVPDLKERGPYKMQNNVLTVEIAHDKPLSEVKKQHGRNTGTRTRARGGHRGGNANNSAGTTNVTMNRDSGVHEAAQPQDNAASHRRVGGRRRERETSEPSERGQTRHHSRPHHRHHSKDHHHHHRGTRSPTAAAAQLQPQGQPRQRRSASSYSGSSSIASISSYTSSRSRSSGSYASTRSGRSRERNGPTALRRREEPYRDVTQPAPASLPHAPLQAPAQAPPMSGFPTQQQQRPLVNAMPPSSIMRPGQPGLAATGSGAAMPPFAASLAQNNTQVNPFDTGFSSSRPPAVPFPQLNAAVPTNTHLAANNPSSINTSNNMNNTNSSSSGGNVGPASQPSPAPASEMFVCLPMALCPPQFLCDPRVFTARLDRTRVGALTICGSVLQTFPMPEATTTNTGHTGGFGAKAENVSSYGGLNSSSATFANSDAFVSGAHPPPPPPPPKSIMRPPMQAPPSDLDMRNRMR